MKMEIATDERTEMLKAAIAACFKARVAVTPTNVRGKLPSDFWTDEQGDELSDDVVFAEIKEAFNATAKPAAEPVEPFPNWVPPSDKVEPVATEVGKAQPIENQGVSLVVDQANENQGEKTEEFSAPLPTAAPVPIESTPSHAATGPGHLSPQERLNAARLREGNLLAGQRSLQHAVRNARENLQEAKIAYAACDPNRMTPAMLSADYRKSSQAERAARVARQGTGQPRIAYVDQARKFSTGGDGSDFVRRRNVSGDKRGGFSRAEATARGFVNRDPSRGGTPKPVAAPRVTIPALARK
jgi:hypothetical protein